MTTGHQGGVITLDLSESDDAHRVFVRQQLGQPARPCSVTCVTRSPTTTGRRWSSVPAPSTSSGPSSATKGPPTRTRRLHYGGDSTPAEWGETHVSQYATMHPWEDWAETFAHYLHIHGGLQTADSFGLHVDEPARSSGAGAWASAPPVAIGPMIGTARLHLRPQRDMSLRSARPTCIRSCSRRPSCRSSTSCTGPSRPPPPG
ncbi:MAG: putative zinc-binding metallopeptidase [Ilumatobacteraceae bacterium]